MWFNELNSNGANMTKTVMRVTRVDYIFYFIRNAIYNAVSERKIRCVIHNSVYFIKNSVSYKATVKSHLKASNCHLNNT